MFTTPRVSKSNRALFAGGQVGQDVRVPDGGIWFRSPPPVTRRGVSSCAVDS